ncbi:MAG: hypothetical protein ABS43_01740 [Bordetella sp. SCN 67-23]|nr:phage terminase large subunit family protein [Burkholderiales bacterium]ODS76294.1 MAG: hypothetical protein ABS43_01740 [Bordetella sp. SCN 67-23]OJW90097.1 MAG: hypothetical protein BGO71_27675 [Burkholderiales bacterium 67-32]
MGAVDAFIRSIQDAIRPDDRGSISEWAAKYRILPPDTPEPGPWRNERTPCLVEIMDTLSPASGYTEVWLKKGHQLGGSALGENFIGHAITSAAGNILGVFATIDDANKWNLSRFEPMRTATPALRRAVKDRDVKGSDNTQRRKKFPGGMLQLVGSNRAGGLKSSTIRYVLLEEVDEYPRDVAKQGAVPELARNRTSNFGSKARIFGNSTPTIEGASEIDGQFNRGDQRYYMPPCPACGHRQRLLWENFRWVDSDPTTVGCACVGCGIVSKEHEWKRLFTPDMWVKTAKGQPGVASFHMPSLLAPLGWRSWVDLVVDWLEAQGNPIKLKRFINNELAECWQEQTDRVQWEVLKERAEPYALRAVPRGYYVLTLGVDTQDTWLAAQLVAWGRGERALVLDYFEIHGDLTLDPSNPDSPWFKLDAYRHQAFRNEFGIDLRVSMTAVDTGGLHTHTVYNYCRARRHDSVIAIKGDRPGKPILGRSSRQDVKNGKGDIMKNGVQLWFVGGDTAKSSLFARMDADEEAGRVGADRLLRFSTQLPDIYFKGLTAEVYKVELGRWEKLAGRRNESLDTLVYAYAAACHPTVRIHTARVAEWDELERLLEPRHRDLFGGVPPAAEVAPAAAPVVPVSPAPVTSPVQTSARDEELETVTAGDDGWLSNTDNWLN